MEKYGCRSSRECANDFMKILVIKFRVKFYQLYFLQKNIKQKSMESKRSTKCPFFKFSQVFGSEDSLDNIQEDDIISNLSFDSSGNFLSIGDHAGRIILFKIPSESDQPISNKYEYYSEVIDSLSKFQSYTNEFDYLKSMPIHEKIIDMCWLRHQGRYIKMITANSQSIKIWKGFEKSDRKILKTANRDLQMPKLQSGESSFYATQQKLFPKIHTSPINSISQSYNQQYLLSSDNERNYFWSLENPKKPYVVNEISCKNRKICSDAQLKITCSKMHPTADNLFVFGLNRNGVGVCDLRIPGNRNVTDFGVEMRSTRNFFTEMISCISSAQFLPNTRYVIAREYLNIKIWDIANTKKPLLNVCVDDTIKSQLCELFEQEKIEDKFKVAISQDSNTILTGGYNNNFNLIDSMTGQNIQYELSFRDKTISRPIIPKTINQLDKLDTDSKTSVVAYHPFRQLVAVASLNCFFLYEYKKSAMI